MLRRCVAWRRRKSGGFPLVCDFLDDLRTITMAAQQNKLEAKNAVHQNAILVETILKEQRNQKLFLNYSINPFRKMHTLTGKPNSMHDVEEGEEDTHFKKVIERSHQEPVRKYLYPQTEAQEYGWMTQPLSDFDRTDERLYFPVRQSAITKYMEAAWRVKEQSQNLN